MFSLKGRNAIVIGGGGGIGAAIAKGLAQAGANVSISSTNEEKLKKACAKIKEIDPKSIPLGYDSEGNWFITMTEQYGSDYTSATEPHYLFDNDTNKAFVKKFNEWYQKGYVTTAGLYGAYTSGLFTSTDETRCYMCIGSSAGATYQRPAKGEDGSYPFEVGIATIPQVNAENPKVISQGPSLVILKTDVRNPDKRDSFKELTDQEAMEYARKVVRGEI